jgi:hypothetical protein
MNCRSLVFVAVAALGIGGGSAQAQSLFAPDMQVTLTAPKYFDGLYAGAIMGAMGNNKGNFFVEGGPVRAVTGGVVGVNTYVGDGLVVGAEAQGSITFDDTGAFGYDLFGLAHLGFLTTDDFMTYFLTGVGVVDNGLAFAVGGGFETRAWDNVAFRAEALAYGAIGVPPSGIDNPGLTGIQITTGAIWHLGEESSDANGQWVEHPADPRAFEGLYAGAYVGAAINFGWDYFIDYGHGLHLSRFALGAMGGINYYLTDNFIVSAELQGGYSHDSSGDVGWDALALARVGFAPINEVMVYGVGGLGVLENQFSYAAGGGAEWALWGDAGIRAEIIAIGSFSQSEAFTASKWTAGTVWHFE